MTLVQEATRIMESMPKRNQQIVLELLRVMGRESAYDEIADTNTNENKKAAALELAGLWSNHENELPVDENDKHYKVVKDLQMTVFRP